MPVYADGATMYQARLNTMDINNGFESQYAQTLTFDPATRILTVTPTGTTFKVTAHGVTYTKAGAQTSQVPPISPDLFYYYGAGGTLIATNVAWTIDGEAQVAYVKMNTNDASVVFTVDERHGVNISDEWHRQQHLTIGSKWSSGMALFHNASDTSTAVASTGAGTAVSISNGIMYDEDVEHITVTNGVQSSSLLTTNNSGIFPIMFKDTTNNWVRTAGTAFPFLWSGNVPQIVANGTASNVAEDQYFVYWLVTVGGFRGTNVFLIPHPVTYTSTLNAQNGATPYTLATVLGGLPSAEMLVSHRLIFQFNANPPNANPTAVKSAKLRDVTDFRSLSSGVIFAGVSGAVIESDPVHTAWLNGYTSSASELVKTNDLAGYTTFSQVTNITREVNTFLTFTNLTGSVTLTNQYEAPIAISGTGAVIVAFSGLRVPYPVYFTAQGFSSLTVPVGSYVVGGGSWQTNRVNHFIVWQYGTNLYLNPVITSEVE
jgi:hypothetical protein